MSLPVSLHIRSSIDTTWASPRLKSFICPASSYCVCGCTERDDRVENKPPLPQRPESSAQKVQPGTLLIASRSCQGEHILLTNAMNYNSIWGPSVLGSCDVTNKILYFSIGTPLLFLTLVTAILTGEREIERGITMVLPVVQSGGTRQNNRMIVS